MGQDNQITIKSISMSDGYPIEVDQQALDDYLYPFPWRKRRKRAHLSQIPSDNKKLSGVVNQPDTFIQRHPFADSSQRTEKHDPFLDLEIPQDHYIRPPQTLQTLTRINNRSALIIGAYLAVTLPIASLILMRAFTTTLLPLDPLYDAVVVFFVACVLANVALVCHNHLKGVKSDMTRIADRATSMEMKEFNRTEVLLPSAATLSAHRSVFSTVMAELVEVKKRDEDQMTDQPLVTVIEQTLTEERVVTIVEEAQGEQDQQDQQKQAQQPESQPEQQSQQPEPQLQQQPTPPVGLPKKWTSFYRKTSSLEVVTKQANPHVSRLARFSASMHAFIPSGIKAKTDSTPKQPAPAPVLSSIQNK